MKNLVKTVALAAKGKAMVFFHNEEGEVNIVTTVVLIGIAIAIAMAFGNEILTLITDLFADITTSANTAISSSTTPSY